MSQPTPPGSPPSEFDDDSRSDGESVAYSSGPDYVFAPTNLLVAKRAFSDEADRQLLNKIDGAFLLSIMERDSTAAFTAAVESIKEVVEEAYGQLVKERPDNQPPLIVDLNSPESAERYSIASGVFEFLRVKSDLDGEDGDSYEGSDVMQREAPLYSENGTCAFAIYGNADTEALSIGSMVDAGGAPIAKLEMHLPLSRGLSWVTVAISTITDQVQYKTFTTYVVEPDEGILHYFVLCFDNKRSISMVAQLTCALPPDVVDGGPLPEYIIPIIIEEREPTPGELQEEQEELEELRRRRAERKIERERAARARHQEGLEQSAPEAGGGDGSNWMEQMIASASIKIEKDRELERELKSIEEEAEEDDEVASTFASMQARASAHSHTHHQAHHFRRRAVTTNPKAFSEMDANFLSKLARRAKNFVDSAGKFSATKGVMFSIDTIRMSASVNKIDDASAVEKFEDAAEIFKQGSFPRNSVAVNVKFITIKLSNSFSAKYDRSNKPAWLSVNTEKGYKMLRLILDKPLIFNDPGKSTIDIQVDEVQGGAFRSLDLTFLLSPDVIKDLMARGEEAEAEPKASEEGEREESGEVDEGLTAEQEREQVLQAADKFVNKDIFRGCAFLDRNRAVMMALKLNGTVVTVSDVWIVDTKA